MISLKKIRYFIEIVEAGSYSRAAERLYIAQSALSRQIKELENELQVVLLNRDARHIEATPPGKFFYQRAKTILQELEDSVRQTQHISKGAQGTIRLYHSSSVTITPELGNVLHHLLQEFPGIALDISRASSEHQVIEIDEGRADLGLIRLPILRTYPNVEVQALYSEKLVVAVSQHHPLAQRMEIDIPGLRNEQFVSIPHKDRGGLSHLVAELCRAHGFTPKVARATSRKTSLLHLIAANFGVAVIPESMRSVAPAGIHFLNLPEQEVPSVVGLIHPRTPTPMIANFIHALQHALKTTNQQPPI
jgi:DNA-binding transcriptional LysR family regulator